MRDDERERGDISGVIVNDISDTVRIGIAVDTVIEFQEEADSFVRPRLAHTIVSFEEEVVSSVLGGDCEMVKYGEVADTRKDQILQNGS